MMNMIKNQQNKNQDNPEITKIWGSDNVPELRFPEFNNEGEWEEKIIEDIAISESSSMALNKLELKATGYPVYGADSIVGYIDEFQQNEKFISIVKDGSGVGRLNLCQSQSSILGTLACIKSKNEKQYHLDWIYYLLNKVDFTVYVKGAGIPHIYFSDFKKEKVPVPKPQEQQKIAACLSSLDDLIAAETQRIASLRDHKKGLMQNLFPPAGEKVPKVRFKEFENDGEWVEKKLGEVFLTCSGGTPSTAEKEFYGGKIPFIRSAEINRNITELFLTEAGLNNSSAKMIEKGDLLIALYGANSGDVAISKIDGAINQAILCLKSEFSNEFTCHFLFHKKDWIIARYLQGGQGNLSGDIVKSIELYFPSKAEQQKIASCLSSLDALITAQAEKIEQLKLHKKGLMQGLFPVVKG
jgi:type I restriction enzyme, S subunit